MRRIYACLFGAGAAQQWPRMAKVFAFTAAQHCPGWEVIVDGLPEQTFHPAKNPSHQANTVKLDRWCEAVAKANDGDELLLIDVDTFFVRPLDDLWEREFDIAYTLREPGYKHPLNGGVVFVKVSPRAREFFQVWRQENQRMVDDPSWLRAWQPRYAGINQAALGVMIERHKRLPAQLITLPCREWNCEDSAWKAYDPQVTRIIHVKSALRKMIFRIQAPQPDIRPLMVLWLKLEQQATATEQRVAV